MSMDMINPAAIRTPCTIPSCDDGPGEPCTRHETEQAHAEGEHAFCADDCEAVDFGHRPMNVFTNGRLRAVECHRCPVPWPCTTAVVLGLTDRETA